MVVKQISRSAKFLSTIDKDPSVSSKFVTMDLETRTLNGKMIPYCVSYYSEEEGSERVISFYLGDYISSDEMLKEALYSLAATHDGSIVYLHNFSNFDAVFLIRVLSELNHRTKIKPVIRDGRIIDLKVNLSKGKLQFRDSYQLISASLNSLAKNFNVENKGIFPYNFVNNPDIHLRYWGRIPEFKYFSGITLEQYDEYCSNRPLNIWDLERETKLYCELDCKVLYKVINIFSKQIFDLFSLDIHRFPTLASLAMGIYRSNFLKDDFKIPLIDGAVYNDIKQGYTGGMVDVYKPTNETNTKVYSYDVNSLYPYTMRDFPVPTGTPKFFEGDITKLDPKSFGVFKVEIEAPSDLFYPVLQTRVNTQSGHKTVSPLGSWKGWYFSEELYNAAKFGYKFNVLSGYLFDKGYVFKDYVDFLYQLKANSEKGTPNYMISKLLLNSLYGKFGTDPDNEQHIIIDSSESQNFHKKYVVTDVTDLHNGKELLSYYRPTSNKTENNKPSSKNTSVPVALAITAQARVHMSKLKEVATSSDLNIYYMDTDCIALSGKLDPKYIGLELGLLKLEHVFNDVIYLAPKVYSGKADGYEYTKVKGLKDSITFDELKPILKKGECIKLSQDKWYKDIGQSHITVKDEVYTLMVTDNKRELIFNNDNIFVDTKPLKLTNGSIINPTTEPADTEKT